MRANRRRDTQPELKLRRLLHGMGLRYRVDYPVRDDAPRPVKADIAFPGLKLAVFVDGCFWHGCPDHGQRRAGANRGYWGPKIERNRERDAEQAQRLAAAGWTVLRVWEHVPAEDAAAAIAAHVAAIRER